ncbi:type III restriction/modification enzyme restriction subunit [Krasilnikovia cinnamomea]|uniref:Type III restriction/modification enzyme restriction subunit n=1 Tax=Krasilnikovia cinnamomea TaxID=349313 RepID=A0A4Q7ZF66_9ACTN|nr:DEAD/DEAH box helicase family protein [Krasilnikovia cinnamomea]RZU48735.1 type III restriction/modification enzyme restriction subunit [Krasilnikovia cinnamomea]
MKFTLKPYQADAVASMLSSLERARNVYERENVPTSVSLSATTGAGKTVMAAAVIEALFYGNERFEFELDPGAVVIWFSYSPDLNEQSRFRLMEASDKIESSDLVVIEPPFAKPRLDPGKVYFLNTGKLTKNSLLTRGHVEVEEGQVLFGLHDAAQPDMQGWTIWETIANTINDPDTTVYLILDEAHRGFRADRSVFDKPTTVRKLVNGHSGYPPIPIVWGISATIEQFRDAMAEADSSEARRALPPIEVDGFQVQESGLVKDTVVLEIPAEAQAIDLVLLRRAARKFRESSERWEKYCTDQGLPDMVRPLLILQAPATPDHDKIGEAINVIFEEFTALPAGCVRHVFGAHTPQQFGAHDVNWVEPQTVEDKTHIRILIAKDAISTGWDCPRAEVLVSFRRAREHTHITQLLGRMVRNPLARRVPGDEVLNAVDCILPFFDRTMAGNVVKYLTGKIDGVPDGSGRKAIIEECKLLPNIAVGFVWPVWDLIPTMTVPQRGASPVKRLASLAHALATDGVRCGAVKEVAGRIHAALDEANVEFASKVKASMAEVLAVRLQQISGRIGKSAIAYADVIEQADDRAIRAAFEDARKAFGSDIASMYVDHLVGEDGEDDNLRDAFIQAAALANVPEIRERIDARANEIANTLFAEHSVDIKSLRDDRRSEYEDIRALSVEPQVTSLGRPRTRIEDYVEVDEKTGQESRAPLASKHLMSDGHGQVPITKLNDWEREVVFAELKRSVAWYRNPPRQATDSLGIAYRDGNGNWRSMHPDFIFFSEVNGKIVPSIVDPHGHHLGDSTEKLQGFAQFAEDHGASFHRIAALSRVNGNMRVLDLTKPTVREAIYAGGRTPIEFYESPIAEDYDGPSL